MGLTRIRAEQISDIDYKQAVRVLTLTNVILSGGAPSQVDGVNLTFDDRILVAGQTTASQNGLYYVATLGSGVNGTWTRASDANATGEIAAGMIVMVTEGNTYADTSWKLITNNPIIIGTTGLVFAQNTGASFGVINANGTPVAANGVTSTAVFSSGNNLVLTGNASSDTITFAVSDTPIFTTVSATGNISGSYIIGNGSQLTGLPAGSYIANGTSNVSVLANSSVQIFTPTFNSAVGAVNIVGSSDGNIVATQNPGVVLHLTGTQNTAARIYNDAVGSYSAMVGRRYNGNVNAPTQVLANSIVSRYAATPYTSNGWPAISTARIDMVTTEDQTDTNSGTEIQFWTTAIGTNAIAKVMSLTNNDINLAGNITAIGNLTISTNPNYVNNITVSGTTYDAAVVIDDVGADHVAQLLLNRSSTSVQPILATALNNSDDPTANVDVVNGQTLFQIATVGFAGTDYKEFAGIVIMVDDNANVSETSSPGKIDFRVTPDGSTSTESALTIYNNTTAEFAGNVQVDIDLSVTGNIFGNIISATGNVGGGNILTGGIVSATGNIYSNNIVSTGLISTSGNIVGGGVRSTSSGTAPLNPTVGDFWYNTTTNSQYRFTFDGTDYFWLDDFGATTAENGSFNAITSGTSNVSIYSANSSINISASGTPNVAIFSTAGAAVTGLTITNSNTPTTSAASGVTGQIQWDSNYLYVCIAPNTWKRANINTW
jgi:hypothetical protein